MVGVAGSMVSASWIGIYFQTPVIVFGAGDVIIILATEQTKSRYSGKRHVVIGDRTQPQTLCAALFRELRNESRGMDLIIAESVPAEAQGLAYMNRLLRASGFTVISE